MDLQPLIPLKPFKKWGINFIGLVSPPSKGAHNKYILVVVDYVTKWVEARAFKIDNAKYGATFLYEKIIVQFGYPIESVLNGGTLFSRFGLLRMSQEGGKRILSMPIKAAGCIFVCMRLQMATCAFLKY